MIEIGTFRASANAKKYVNQVLDSGRLSYGPYSQKFEKQLANAHQCAFGVMTNSGTSALTTALAALKNIDQWQDGDEVILPAVTFIATANVIVQLNLKPVFVDVEPDYYCIDPQKIEEKITKRTRCIIPVHMFGLPCDMDPILALAQKHKLRIVEDSCEAMFINYKNRSVGSLGDISCFSTYMGHLLPTGVGGACLTNNKNLEIEMRSIISHGRDPIYLNIDDDNHKSESDLKNIIQRRFTFDKMGYSFKLTEMESALGLAGLEDREEMMKQRWENGMFFKNQLEAFAENLQTPKLRPNCGHSFMMFPLVLKKSNKIDLAFYLEKAGIETRDMMSLVNQTLYKSIMPKEHFPVASWIDKNGLYFGCHQNLSAQDRAHVLKTFESYFGGTSE